MHRFLQSIGFSKYEKYHSVDTLLKKLSKEYTDTAVRFSDEGGEMRMEIRAEACEDMGMCINGVIDKLGRMKRIDYYPYLVSHDISMAGRVFSFLKLDGIRYSAAVDRTNTGQPMIFLLDNPIEFNRRIDNSGMNNARICLAGLCEEGYILLPTEEHMVKTDENGEPVHAGKQGEGTESSENQESARDDVSFMEMVEGSDPETIRQMAFEEMSNIAALARRLHREDIFSIVDTLFMPEGTESDLYLVIGTILEIKKYRNKYTEEKIYNLKLEANNIIIHVAVNEADLMGEPVPGRRFKGEVWVQGRVDFSGMK